MRRLSSFIFTTVLLLLIGSCVIPFEIDIEEYDKVIVVEGVVTTELKRHSVHLSYTTPLSSDGLAFLQGADVWVEKSDGEVFSFIEESPGDYKSNIEFAAEADYEYQLFFRTATGKLYQSTKDRPIPSPPIDSIYDRYAELIQANSTTQEVGIQFFLDSYDPTGNAKNFRYEWEETYKIVTPYKSILDYDNSLGQIVYREIPIDICYSTNTSTSLIIGTSVGTSANRIVEFPVQFVTGDTDILRNRYSILVRQFSVSNATYNYYQRIKTSERQGTLFDEQQGSVIGNIISADDPNEVVLGNFEVSGVSSLRAFFSLGDLDDRILTPDYRYRCIPDDIISTSVSGAVSLVQSNTYNIVDIVDNEVGPPTAIMAPDLCSDCTEFATNVKPDFWIDE